MKSNRETKPYLGKWVEEAEKLAKQHGGVIPRAAWLRAHGYGSLYQRISENPEAFAHLPQDNQTYRRMQQVKLAEQLAKENGGLLPHTGWLIRNGYDSILSLRRKWPKLFRHIPQDSKDVRIGLDGHLKRAKQLIHSHGGKLPPPVWLQKNGYNRLDMAYREHRRVFKGIGQRKAKAYRKWQISRKVVS